MKRASTRDAVVALLLAAVVAAATVVSASARSGSHASQAASAAPTAATATPCPSTTATPSTTAVPSGTPTGTPVPPTETPTNTPTSTPVPPTETPANTPTSTPVPPTETPANTPTSTPVPPTETPANTPTSTPVPPTETPANTPTDTPEGTPTAGAGPRNAASQPTPNPFGTGKAEGKGEINTACGVGHFDFHVERKTASSPITGSLHYVNKSEGIDLKSTSITFFAIAGNTADFSGTCTNNGSPCTFSVHVEDNGKPGKNKDVFEITITPGPTEGGVIRSGEITVHQT